MYVRVRDEERERRGEGESVSERRVSGEGARREEMGIRSDMGASGFFWFVFFIILALFFFPVF